VDEVRLAIVAYATAMERQCRVAELGTLDPWNPNVDGHGLQVKAVSGDTAAPAAQVLVAPRRAVAADHVAA